MEVKEKEKKNKEEFNKKDKGKIMTREEGEDLVEYYKHKKNKVKKE